MSEFLGPVGEVGTSDALDEEGVTGQKDAIGHDVDRRPTVPACAWRCFHETGAFVSTAALNSQNAAYARGP
jgi:hypothetical protein